MTGPNGSGRPFASMNSAAVRMISSERASHSLLDPPQAVMPWPPRMQPMACGFAAAMAAMSSPSWKPGRRHDAGSMMPRVHDDGGLRAEGETVQQGGAPVRDVGGVERRLEQLVLQQHPLMRREPGVDHGKSLGEPVLAGPDVVLAGVVGAIGEPQLQVPRTGLVHDVHAGQQVIQGLAADRGVGVGDAAQLVVIILEHVRVNRPDRDPRLRREGCQRGIVVNLVPRDVHGHTRRDAGELVYLRRVRDLLLRRARHTGLGEHLEPGPGVTERPRRRLNPLRPHHRACRPRCR